MEDLPYLVEYARTGRASCKGCKLSIAQDSLRIARMVQSGFHDGKQSLWFHQACFFKKQRPSSEGDIAGFETIRHEDQELIRKKIAECSSTVQIVSKKGKKRAAEPEVKMTKSAARDFGIEYAKSGRAECRGCETKILKDEIRVKKVSFDTEVGMKYGGQALWHHLDCFGKLRHELGWFSAGNQLPGYKDLRKDDLKTVDDLLPAVKAEDVAEVKKPKLEVKAEVKDEVDASFDSELDKKLIAQNKEFFKHRDNCKVLTKKQMISILQKNNQDVSEGKHVMLDALAELLTFGALKRCDTCKGQFVLNKSNYICSGNIDEWVKCENMLKEPPRVPVRFPKDIDLDKFSFLNHNFKVKARAIKYVPPTTSKLAVKKEEEPLEPKIHRERAPLHMMEFFVIGRTEKARAELREAIQKLGGKLSTTMHANLAAVISTEKEVKRMSEKMREAQTMGIQVIRESFVDELGKSGAIEYIKTKTICDWGNDPLGRIPQEELKSAKSKSKYTKSVPKSVTLKLTNGTAVDPDSGLDGDSVVYIVDKIKYSVVLCKADIQSDQNSFYKIQILKTKNKNAFYVFRSWGRIGTTIGGNKLQSFPSSREAIANFDFLYHERTGYHFGAANQTKLPGRYNLVETDFGEEIENKLVTESTIKSKLEEPVQSLIKLIFDVDTMRKTMVEFDLDMEKMPLGKLSKKQLSAAMLVLHKISEFVRDSATDAQFIGASNQFYTLIPHDFGVDRPPVINTVAMVNAKTEMLESLIEMEFAYGLLKVDDDGDGAAKVNPLDAHYKQLNTELKSVARDSEEYALLSKYVQNTHAETHRNFELEIENIFTVDRSGEKRRYKPFKKLHNRQLLWHGSRLTNYAGILSHGLKIAPPEAPVTGYMFGKGIYFADMVSKSANYCCTSKNNSTGLMMLCEVALGDMMECLTAKYVEKLPKDKHSTKGVGRTCPNPKEAHRRADGVEIPLGKAIANPKVDSSLLYNEYIVYDVAQVNVQYLFKLNFKHKF